MIVSTYPICFFPDWSAVSHRFTHFSITGSSTMAWLLY
jgi:hypothetical protein